jgi:cell wall-associated NlpC family hydrolase
MSKVQGKDANLLSNLSGSEIANELDTRLRDLEKNIAVAREFIKLADESYSELRHKWNLLHEEVRSKSQSGTKELAGAENKTDAQPRTKAHAKTKVKEANTVDEQFGPSSADISSKPETHVKRAKNANRSKKEPETSSENTNAAGSEKLSQPYRDPGRRRGKTSSHN